MGDCAVKKWLVQVKRAEDFNLGPQGGCTYCRFDAIPRTGRIVENGL